VHLPGGQEAKPLPLLDAAQCHVIPRFETALPLRELPEGKPENEFSGVGDAGVDLPGEGVGGVGDGAEDEGVVVEAAPEVVAGLFGAVGTVSGASVSGSSFSMPSLRV